MERGHIFDDNLEGKTHSDLLRWKKGGVDVQFFVVIFILMSGIFTPIESMPQWAQNLTELNPVKYYVEVMRMVMLKGSGFMDILPQFIKITIYAIIMNALAVWSYKKTT